MVGDGAPGDGYDEEGGGFLGHGTEAADAQGEDGMEHQRHEEIGGKEGNVLHKPSAGDAAGPEGAHATEGEDERSGLLGVFGHKDLAETVKVLHHSGDGGLQAPRGFRWCS